MFGEAIGLMGTSCKHVGSEEDSRLPGAPTVVVEGKCTRTARKAGIGGLGINVSSRRRYKT